MFFELSDLPKTKTHSSTDPYKYNNILEHQPNHLYIFTDGSKKNDRTGCAAILNKKIRRKPLPKESSIFSAGACAIDLALNIKKAS